MYHRVEPCDVHRPNGRGCSGGNHESGRRGHRWRGVHEAKIREPSHRVKAKPDKDEEVKGMWLRKSSLRLAEQQPRVLTCGRLVREIELAKQADKATIRAKGI